MNVVQLPQQLRSCSNVTRDATTATLGVATGSNKTEASQRRLQQQLQQSQPIKCASCGCSRVAIELAAQHRLFRAALSAASRRVVPESHMVCDYELTRLECRCAPDGGTDADNVPLAAHIFISSTTATTTCNNNS